MDLSFIPLKMEVKLSEQFPYIIRATIPNKDGGFGFTVTSQPGRYGVNIYVDVISWDMFMDFNDYKQWVTNYIKGLKEDGYELEITYMTYMEYMKEETIRNILKDVLNEKEKGS